VNGDRPLPGGKLEYAILVAIWEGGTVTGRELHDRVGEPLGLVYTTTAKILDRLAVKGLVQREKDGKVFRYRATAPRQEIDRARLTRTLAGVFAEGPRPALAALVEVLDELSPDLLDELSETIETRRKSRREP
jgi:predicted transcriptional regulator